MFQKISRDVAHEGWIGAYQLDAPHLKSLGVVLGAYDARRHLFDGCRVSGAALAELAAFGGIYNWAVWPVEHQAMRACSRRE